MIANRAVAVALPSRPEHPLQWKMLTKMKLDEVWCSFGSVFGFRRDSGRSGPIVALASGFKLGFATSPII